MSRYSNSPILLVDDDRDDVDLTLLALKLNDIKNEVIIARDGREAIELLQGSTDTGSSRTPALVLMDINMPGMDGLETLKVLRDSDSTRFLPVVMLTTSTNPDDVSKSYTLGANSFINKPADFEKFSKVIGEIGKYWLDVNIVTRFKAECATL
jgi:CheY-like chemotaxis protein